MSGRVKRTLKVRNSNLRTKLAIQKLRMLRTGRRTLKAPKRQPTVAPLRRSPRLMTLKFVKNLQNKTSIPKEMRKTLTTAIKKKRTTSQRVKTLKAKAAEATNAATAMDEGVVAELHAAEVEEKKADAELDDLMLSFASAKI